MVGAENIGLERMDALLFIAHTKRKLSIFLFFSSHKYITNVLRMFFDEIRSNRYSFFRSLPKLTEKSS